MGEVASLRRGGGVGEPSDTVEVMGEKEPLQPLISAIEGVRDRCYACDRAPLEDMLGDLRRWAEHLAESQGDPETSSNGARPQAQRADAATEVLADSSVRSGAQSAGE
jgi:hypothetical protein